MQGHSLTHLSPSTDLCTTEMAFALGKRKRVSREEFSRPSRSPSPSSHASDSEGQDDLQAIFRRAFEAKFKPLDAEPKKKPKIEKVEIEEEEEEESDWSGISSEDEDSSGNQVEVFDYAAAQAQRTEDKASKSEMRAFMVPLSSSATLRPNLTLTVLKTAHKPDPTHIVIVEEKRRRRRLGNGSNTPEK